MDALLPIQGSWSPAGRDGGPLLRHFLLDLIRYRGLDHLWARTSAKGPT